MNFGNKNQFTYSLDVAVARIHFNPLGSSYGNYVNERSIAMKRELIMVGFYAISM